MLNRDADRGGTFLTESNWLFLPHSLLIGRKRHCLCSGTPFCYHSKHSSEVSHGEVPNAESFSGTRSLSHSSSIMSKLPRSYSDKYVPGQGEYDLFKNLNAEWITGPFIKVFYIALVAVFAAVLYVSQVFSFEDMWTVTNIAHGVVSNRYENSLVIASSLLTCDVIVADHLHFFPLDQGLPR